MTEEKQALDLQAWVGRERAERDVATSSQAMALAATLDRDPEVFRDGAELPEIWHWIYFRPVAAQRSRLGRDGHERRGDFLPPVEQPRRMWAGGRLNFRRPIVIGEKIFRTSKITAIEQKTGSAGPLVLVTVQHVISDGTDPCVEEQQDLVYVGIRESGKLPRQQPPLPPELDWRESFTPDAVTLFRFSALTFNGHRIHYDHPFATGVEGYRGIVVHGPFTALLLLDAAKRQARRTAASYRYRGLAPLFNEEPITLAGKSSDDNRETDVWAAGPAGTIAMQGRVGWRE